MGKFENLKIYLKQIHNTPSLTEEERKKLFSQIRKKGKGSEKARLKIIQDNLSLVINLAKKYYYSGMNIEFLDFIEEGNIGLVKAVERYDSKKGFKFSTYASWWIEKHFQEACIKSRSIIQFPEKTWRYLKKIDETTTDLLHQTGRSPDIKELSKKIDISIVELRKTLWLAVKMRNVKSLDYFLDGEGTITLEDVLSKEELSVDEKDDNENRKELVGKLLNYLTDEERKVLKYRFALDENKRCSYEEISEKLKISQSKASEIYGKAIRKLRNIAKRKFGEGHLHFSE